MSSSSYRSARGDRFVLFLIAVLLPALFAQSTKATFGKAISLGGTPSDIVLDELRNRLYLVNSAANRIDVYDYAAEHLLSSIPVGTTPVAAAMTPDGSTLYVTNTATSTLSVIERGRKAWRPLTPSRL
ncbi:MAG: hypothetical protein NTY38_15880 [Acidobacteria bacterium]|nr:hypothetical protein [Acidobacteriota bacterium]